MPRSYSYCNPVLSLWQSAVAAVRASGETGSNLETAMEVVPSKDTTKKDKDPLMDPVHMIAEALLVRDRPSSPQALESLAPSLIMDQPIKQVSVDCAKTAAQFLLAEMKGDQATADHLAGILKFAPCNVGGWAECVTTYLQYKNSGGTFPYRPGVDSVHALGDRKRIAIIGDWGTGESDAINLLRQVQKFNPDVLIHLGDVYFAGTQPEQKSNFVDVCKRILGNDVLLFSLCGNHDMYSGGEGYYWMLDQIGQKASYFCLKNDDWQFLALDTGHNDSNPATIAGNLTSLMEGEGDWHLAHINRDKAPRTVLLSHHQLFSPFGAVGTEGSDAYAFNPHLYDAFKGVIPQIVWWFWGHEHTLAVFDEYMGLKRGRCLGASAVPVYFNEQSYQNASGLETLNHGPLPTWNGKAVLAVKDTLYGHAFAIMTLDGRSANVDYYQVFGSGDAVRLDVTDKA